MRRRVRPLRASSPRVSSRHLDGRLVSERRTHSTATGHSPTPQCSNLLTAKRPLTPLFVDALTTYYILRKNRRVAAVTRRPLSQQANSLLRTEAIASFGLSSFRSINSRKYTSTETPR